MSLGVLSQIQFYSRTPGQWPGDPEKCQWPQWPRTLLGHRDFPEGPVTRWPREMSVASVARDFAGPPGLSRRPSDLVTPRNVSGLSGPGLCRATRDNVILNLDFDLPCRTSPCVRFWKFSKCHLKIYIYQRFKEKKIIWFYFISVSISTFLWNFT